MSRGLSVAMLAAINAARVRPAYFVHLALDTGALRVWSGTGTYTLDGADYLGVGDFGGQSEIEEGKTIAANGLALSLSGVPSDQIAMTLAEKYRGRTVYERMVLFDLSTLAPIADPAIVFAGRIDTMAIRDDGPTSSISVACESRLVDLDRARERRYTHEDQQELYPGDTSFRYVPGLQDKEVPWNQKPNAGASTQAPPSGALSRLTRLR